MAIRSLWLAICAASLLTNCSHETESATKRGGSISAISIEAAALFGQFCLDAPPDLSAIDRRATNSSFKVFLDRPIAPGASQKEWLVPIPSNGAPLLLSVESGPSADGMKEVTVCGVFAVGARGPDLQHTLSNDPRLGRPDRVSPAPQGGTSVSWSARFGGARQSEDAQVMLAYDVPGMGGPFVNLTFKRQR
jgi:hypothetical protein